MKFIYCFVLLCLSLTNISKAQELSDPIPEHKTFTIQSKRVEESRTINVWLPDQYNVGAVSLPVLYMLDGGIKEDFPHVANTLAALIKEKKIKPVILVGIENTQRRRDLTGPTSVEKDKEIARVVGRSEQFRAFISDELFAEINKRYRTTARKGIIGESLAGLFITETFFLKPSMFDFYIAFDPSLWWNDQYLLKTANEHLKDFPSAKKTFWFAGSGTKEIFEGVAKLADILKTRNIPNLTWNYLPEPKEQHSTIFRATKEKALIWSLKD